MSANLLFMNSGNWSESQILSFSLKKKKHLFPIAKVFEEWTDLILPYSIDKQNNGTNGKFFFFFFFLVVVDDNAKWFIKRLQKTTTSHFTFLFWRTWSEDRVLFNES